jgi:hypothetical protein
MTRHRISTTGVNKSTKPTVNIVSPQSRTPSRSVLNDADTIPALNTRSKNHEVLPKYSKGLPDTSFEQILKKSRNSIVNGRTLSQAEKDEIKSNR